MAICSVLLCLAVFYTHYLGVYAGEFCYYESNSNLGYNVLSSLYCTDGCCGYYYDRTCCTSVGVIAGAVVAILICLGIIGIVIACLCISNKSKSAKATSVDNAISVKMTSTATSVPLKEKKRPAPSTTDHPAPIINESLPGQMTNPGYQSLSVPQMNTQPLLSPPKPTEYQQLMVLPAKTRESTPRAHIYDNYDNPPAYYQ